MKQIASSYVVQALLVIISTIFIGYLYITSAGLAHGMTYCQSINNSGDVLRDGYGSPFNFFTEYATLAIQVLCSEDGAQITVGTGSDQEYILDYALQRVDGRWKKIPLSGETKVGSWYIGTAQGLMEESTLEVGETTRVLAYICQKVDGIWRCGCRDDACLNPYWQLQEFEYLGVDNETYMSFADEQISEEGYITTPNPVLGPVGTIVTLTGDGLSSINNTVLFDNKVVAEHVSSQDGKNLTFTIPGTVTPGYKMITVLTDEDEEIFGTSFIVTVPGMEKPVVTSISPNRGEAGTEVTVLGRNFSKNGNDVLLSLGVLKGVVSSDGTSLTFKLDPLKDLMDLEGVESTQGEMPIHVVVVNGGGASENLVFTLEL